MIVANPAFDAAGKETATPTPGQPVNAVDAQQRLRFDPLPGTAAEAAALSKVLPEARVYTGANATEILLKEMRAPSILHIATHGFFLRPTGAQTTGGTRGLSIVPAPTSSGNRQDALVLSGLALAGANQRTGGSDQDGILTALEATGLNLWGTRMVVLSACETGVGDARNGEGVYGLRRALVLAGSESQVMSLWQVSDTATTDLTDRLLPAAARGRGKGRGAPKRAAEFPAGWLQAEPPVLLGQLHPVRGLAEGLRLAAPASESRARDAEQHERERRWLGHDRYGRDGSPPLTVIEAEPPTDENGRHSAGLTGTA